MTYINDVKEFEYTNSATRISSIKPFQLRATPHFFSAELANMTRQLLGLFVECDGE